MEYYAFGSCKDTMRRLGRPFTEPEAGAILAQVCAGLAFLHARSVYVSFPPRSRRRRRFPLLHRPSSHALFVLRVG
jgi:serine/threonine protein kinase